MKTLQDKFSPEEIATLAGLSRRTIRFYVQEGVLPPPNGAKRGAWYGQEHLARLLQIREWQRAGFTLDQIRSFVEGGTHGADSQPERRQERQPGEIYVRSRVLLAPGIELELDPQESGMGPAEIRELRDECMFLIEKIRNRRNNP